MRGADDFDLYPTICALILRAVCQNKRMQFADEPFVKNPNARTLPSATQAASVIVAETIGYEDPLT